MTDAADTETDENIIEDIKKLFHQKIDEAYVAGYLEGERQGRAQGVLAQRDSIEHIEGAARTVGMTAEREALRAYLATNGKSYHAASEAAKFIKRAIKYLDDRERTGAQ